MKYLVKHLTALTLLLMLTSLTLYSQPSVVEHDINIMDENIPTVVGEDGLAMISMDGGQTWIEFTTGVTNTLFGVAVVDNFTTIAIGENGLVIRTLDGGDNWTIVSTGTTSNLNKIAQTSSTSFIICGDDGTILASDDLGENWETRTSGTTNKLNDVNFFDGNIGYIVGNEIMLKTLDGGNTWLSIYSLEYTNLTSLAVFSETKVVVVGEQGFMAYTLDGGDTWNDPGGSSFIGSFRAIEFSSQSTGVAVGDNGLIARSNDGGLSWEAVNSTITNDIMSVGNWTELDMVAVGEDGIELYSYDGGASWSISPLFDSQLHTWSGTNSVEIKMNNSPNPFNPATKISFSLPFDANVTLKIYDMAGREVASLLNSDFRKAGNHTLEFNGRDLSSGVYVYRLSADGQNAKTVKTMKMILTK